MFNKIISFSIKNKLFIGILTLALICVGIYSLTQIPIDAVPDITNNQVQIVTTSKSLAPQEVEQYITYPVEIAMANIPDVEEIRSISRYGLSVVTLIFKDDVDILKARQFVSEQIKEAENEIPESLGSPEMMPITTGLGEIYQYILTIEEGYEDQYSITDLRTIQDWIVRRQLMGTPGIIDVSTYGGKLKQYEIAIYPSSLRNYNLSITNVFEALSINNENAGGSYIEKGNSSYYIRALGTLKSKEEIANVVVKTVNEVPILVKDIAAVRIGSAPRFGAMTMDGKGEVVGGISLMYKGENSAKVIQNVKERIQLIEKALPKGVKIQPYLDRSELVGRAISTVSKNLLEGGLIVIFVLVLLLGNFRAGLVVASVIPLSLLFAITLMNIFGVSANLMSLGAIDFGLVVDGSIIVVEAIIHKLYIGKNRVLTQSEMDDAVFNSSSKIRKSAAFGEIIILIVYLPILAFTGIEGKMFTPMAQTVSFAILGALILSLTYVPMMSALCLNKKIVIKESIADKIMNYAAKVYLPLLKKVLSHSKKAIAITLIIFIGSCIAFSNMGGEFIPTLEEGDLALQASIQPGSSLTESINTTTKIERLLKDNFPEVKHVVSKIGAAEIPTDPMGIENFDIMIAMKPQKEWVTSSDRQELAFLMKEKLEEIIGLNIELTQPIQLRFNELISGSKSDIAIKLFGENTQVLYQKANQIAQLIRPIRGIGDLNVEQVTGLPQLLIEYDRAQIARYGVSVNKLNTIIKSAYAGAIAGIVYENERKFDLVVRLYPEAKKDLDLSQLTINSSQNIQVPLNELAAIKIENGPNQISRENAQRRVTIGINARNRDVESLVKDIQNTLNTQLELPPGYVVKYGGQFENLNKAKKRLSIAVPVALALIIFLLFITFDSFKYALLIFTAVPLSAIGGIAALYLRGMPFSISAGIGFIALFGVAVLNGIVLISYFNTLKKEHPEMSIVTLIIEGAKVRLRPVLLTATVASLGFLPMAISTSAGAEVQKPLATVVIGGLISATFLTLLILPALYQLIERKTRLQKPNTLIIIALLSLGLNPIYAQQAPQKLSQEQAMTLATKNSLMLKRATLAVQNAKAVKKGAIALNPFTIRYQDVGVGENISETELHLQQNFGSILTHIQKNKLANTQIQLQESNAILTKRQLKKNVKTLYQQWQYLYARLELINEQLENNTYIQKLSNTLHDTGEISGLEDDLTALKTASLNVKKSSLLKDFLAVETRLKEELQIDYAIQPKNDLPEKLVLPTLNQELSSDFSNSLTLQNEVSEKQLAVAKSRFFPEITAGIVNRKTGNATAYNGFKVQLDIPLWFWSTNAKIKQQKLLLEQSKLSTATQSLTIQNTLENTKKQLSTLDNQLTKINTQTIKKTEAYISKLKIAFKEGELDAYQYAQSFDTYYQAKSNFIELVLNYNQAIIDYEYFINKN
ncbi:CusA/CzcA family heavy metal efflux RND transporter [Aquimarina rhabdastrellae]